MKKGITIALLLSLFLWSCDKYSKEDLSGNWEVSQILEEEKPLQVDFSSINFTFTPEGKYQYQGTLNYRESGSYYIDGELLYTLDTLNEGSMEKAVKIEQVTQNLLVLKMNEQGKERILQLNRQVK